MLEFQSLIKKEIEAQGHKLTGKLINSVTFEVQQLNGGFEGTMFIADYGMILEKGVKPNRIPFTFGSGKKTSKYIQGLIDFFQKRGLHPKAAKSAAFATARVQKREGLPTRKSFRFSKNGRRKGFIKHTLDNNIKALTAKIEQQSADKFRITLGQIFQQAA